MTTRRRPRAASFKGLKAKSARTSAAARSSSRKRDTRCEVLLQKELHRRGLDFEPCVTDLLGAPDVVFRAARLVVFVDGDFWHGRNLSSRLKKLEGGHNGAYWSAKILGNVRRDRRTKRVLRAAGWRVLRFWESAIRRDATQVADKIERELSMGRKSKPLGVSTKGLRKSAP